MKKVSDDHHGIQSLSVDFLIGEFGAQPSLL
jgi:hypothetical protein